jgi:hypothetical protein
MGREPGQRRRRTPPGRKKPPAGKSGTGVIKTEQHMYDNFYYFN